jgi:thiol-disulfide isomerase/thioredoxin
MIAPIMEELAGKHARIAFLKLDIDNAALADVVKGHSVAAVPTFVSYRGAQRDATFTGADKAQLAAMVQQLAGAR